MSHSLESRLKKLAHYDEKLSNLSASNVLINSYVKNEMLAFTRDYGRKLRLMAAHSTEEPEHEELETNLESTKLLYEAIEKGVSGLMETLDPVFENFPVRQPQIISSIHG